MLSGATAPAIRDAVGGRAGYRVMGVVDGAAHRGRRGRRLRRHPARADRRGRSRARGTPARPAADRRRRPRLPAAADHVRAAGARDRVRCSPASTTSPRDVLGRHGRGHDPVRLLRRPGAAAHAGVGGGRRADRQEARLRRRVARPGRRRAARRAGAVGAAGRWSYARDRRWSASGTPAARCSRWRCCPTPRPSTRAGPARTGPASTPACGPPARPSAWRSGPGVFALVLALGGYVSSTDGDVAPARLRAHRDRARLLAAARRR